MSANTKKCCDCKQTKEVEEFYKHLDGYQKRCKLCTKVRNTEFKTKKPDYHKAGNPGYTYDKIKDKSAYNKKRYKARKNTFETYNQKNRQTPRGALDSVIGAIKTRASKAGYSLDFDLDYLVSLYDQQSGQCAATGIPFNLKNESRIKRFRPFSVSIDRINPNGRYEKSNIRLVCVVFNLALNAFGEDVFRRVAAAYLSRWRPDIVP